MTDLSVIILNWNTKEDLRRCLASMEPSVLGQERAGAGNAGSGRRGAGAALAEESPIEVIVVDNASTDGSVQMAQEHFPWANVIANAQNVGYSAGNNLGIEAATGRHLLLLNPDTVIHDDALMTLVQFTDARPEAGIVGAKLLNRDGSLQYSCRRFPTLANGFFRDTPLGRLFPKNRYNRDYLMTNWDHSTPREVDWVSGAAMLIRRECLEEIGTLDEGFFMYCEDVDICFRARERGWKVFYCPDAVITHLIAQASDQNAAAMLMERHRSMYRFFRKHYADTAHPLIWPVVVAGLSARAGALVVKNKIDRWRMARQVRRDQQKNAQ